MAHSPHCLSRYKTILIAARQDRLRMSEAFDETTFDETLVSPNFTTWVVSQLSGELQIRIPPQFMWQ
jgi:hypothetical protein